MVKIEIVIYLVLALVSIAVGVIGGYSYRKKVSDSKIEELKNAESRMKKIQEESEKIIQNAEKEAKALKKEIEIKAKDEVYTMKDDAEKEIKASKKELQAKEQKLDKKEENLDKKIEKLENQEKDLEKKNSKLDEKEKEIDVLVEKGQQELERISGLTKEDAKGILLQQLEGELTHESAVLIKEYEKRLEEDKSRLYRRILSTAIAKGASDYVVESTVSVVHLPNDEMKGRIIGREGRNIRTIEALSGVDIIIDDTPEAVVISSFDSVRREIAKIAVEKLVQDGRIHPAKIEEAIEKAKKEVNAAIIEAGEQALMELGIPGMNTDVVKMIGKLRYRTSYGQNILMHSIEVGHLAGVMASELGVDMISAKRAGLLHDIGKAMDHEIEGSHAVIGAEYLKKYKEKPKILNAVAAHHGDEEFGSIEAILVQAADALSASRPGARRETLETYLKRLEGLEKIASGYDGVETAFAIQAGRELRIIVKPDEINDDASVKMSRDISKQVEENIQYPGQIKVTVVRETRAIDYAK